MSKISCRILEIMSTSEVLNIFKITRDFVRFSEFLEISTILFQFCRYDRRYFMIKISFFSDFKDLEEIFEIFLEPTPDFKNTNHLPFHKTSYLEFHLNLEKINNLSDSLKM